MALANPVIFICPHCGSPEVHWDATAEWDPTTQSFSLVTEHDQAWCNSDADCGEINPHALRLSLIPQTLPLLILNTQMALAGQLRDQSHLQRYLIHLYYEDHPDEPEAVYLGVI